MSINKHITLPGALIIMRNLTLTIIVSLQPIGDRTEKKPNLVIETLCLGPEKQAARLPPSESISKYWDTDGDFRMIRIQNTKLQNHVYYWLL